MRPNIEDNVRHNRDQKCLMRKKEIEPQSLFCLFLTPNHSVVLGPRFEETVPRVSSPLPPPPPPSSSSSSSNVGAMWHVPTGRGRGVDTSLNGSNRMRPPPPHFATPLARFVAHRDPPRSSALSKRQTLCCPPYFILPVSRYSQLRMVGPFARIIVFKSLSGRFLVSAPNQPFLQPVCRWLLLYSLSLLNH